MNRPQIADYTIPEPELPAAAWALAVGVVIGLIALFLAALAAFTRVTESPLDAVFKAAVVEVSMIVESLAVARARRKRDYVLPTVGVVISLWVSGVYNYVQAAAIGALHSVTDPWQLWPLALGPLAAVATLSLNLGSALREHEAAVATYTTDRQKWLDEAVARWEQAEREAQAAKDLADREAAERTARRADALERARLRSESERVSPATLPATAGIPPVAPPTTGSASKRFGSKAEFLQFMVEANGTAPKNAEELKALGVPHTTAYRWWKDWQAHTATAAELN